MHRHRRGNGVPETLSSHQRLHLRKKLVWSRPIDRREVAPTPWGDGDMPWLRTAGKNVRHCAKPEKLYLHSVLGTPIDNSWSSGRSDSRGLNSAARSMPDGASSFAPSSGSLTGVSHTVIFNGGGAIGIDEMRSRIPALKKIARTLRNHKPLILNWFRASFPNLRAKTKRLARVISIVRRTSLRERSERLRT